MIRRVQDCQAEIDFSILETAFKFTNFVPVKFAHKKARNEIHLDIQVSTIRVKNRSKHFFRRRASSEDLIVPREKVHR